VYEATTTATGLPVNVDFFSAVVYDALGIPPDFCTSIFAVGRASGWFAHALEQCADNRLIRPRAAYVGPAPRTMETSMASSPKA
jgi:citrate synthase